MGIVAAYLSSLGDSGPKSSTIGRKAAAIGYRHKQAGHEPPTNQEGGGRCCAASAGPWAPPREGKARVTADMLKQMLALCPDTLIGARDRALQALGFAGAFRRSELVALEVADLVGVAGRAAGDDPAPARLWKGRGPRWPSCVAAACARSRPSRCG